MFLAEDIMTRDVVTVAPTASMKTIASKMANRKISSIIVVEKKMPVGIISERDFVRRVFSRNKGTNIKAKDIMSYPVLSVRPRDTVAQAVNIMKENSVRHLLVTEENNIHGIITETDLLRGETNYVKAHQFLQNLIIVLFLALLLLFVVVFKIKP